MSAVNPPSEGSRVIIIFAAAALVYAITLFGFYGGAASHTSASWIGRLGSIGVLAGVLMHRRRFTFLRCDQSDARFPLLARLLMLAGMAAIVAGFAMSTVGW